MSDFNPEKIYTAIVDAGIDWSDKQAAAELLEESKKSVLAELANASPENSATAREMVALASPAYRLHLAQMTAARHEANKARVRYDAVKVLSEMRRTVESTRRAEMQIR